VAVVVEQTIILPQALADLVEVVLVLRLFSQQQQTEMLVQLTQAVEVVVDHKVEMVVVVDQE
jgi:hypothetical protein